MRTSLFVSALLALLFLSPAGQAQQAQQGRGGRGAAAVPSPPHDPHDLAGVWLLTGGDGGRGNAAARPGASPLPPKTPEGLARMKANVPALGPKGVVPAKANDPLGDANPPGLLRTLIYSRP